MYEYDQSAELGRGRYATVYAAKCRDKPGTDKNHSDQGEAVASDCALKIIDKKEFWKRVVKNKERADTVVREAAVQATMTTNCSKIPAFVRLRGFLETSDHIALELELLESMDLFQYVSARGFLPEKEAALVLRDILAVLDGMTRAGLAHRDIKPANCLVCKAATEDAPEWADCVVKVADFGMSTFVGVDGLVRGRCGTPGYVAPEIFVAGLHGGYGNKVDVFSAGVTLYVMLCGYEPFYGETDEELVAANKSAQFEFPDNDWRNGEIICLPWACSLTNIARDAHPTFPHWLVSLEAKDLVKRMMEPNPSRRLCAKEALRHPWILRHAGATGTASVVAHSGIDALGDSLHMKGQTCVIS
jgi:serine/threonine protein kinase